MNVSPNQYLDSEFLYAFRDANTARYGKFKNTSGDVIDCDTWTNGDWCMALLGEIGEAAEILEVLKAKWPVVPTPEEKDDLGSEYADVLTYIDILGFKLNMDLVSAIGFHGHKFGWKSGWTANDYMVALVANAGKVGNWLKKILRGDVKMYSEKNGQTIRYWVEEGFAGMLINLFILAQGGQIDLLSSTITKWNKVSEKIDFPMRLD